jgi:hypothetical protein
VKLHAINDQGAEVLGELLAPFFQALLPAFLARADQILVEPVGAELKIDFGGESKCVPLVDSSHNYSGVAFLRILILSGMSLDADIQTGEFRVRCDQRLIPVVAESRSDRWALIFRPAWDRAESAPIGRHVSLA